MARAARPVRRFDHHRPHQPGRQHQEDRPRAFLIEHGVQPADFNSYGARRGNDEVMMRGTFANIRIKNLMVPGEEGGVTQTSPPGAASRWRSTTPAMRYQADGTCRWW